MKIAILWTGLSGYLNSCLQELNERGVECLVVHSSTQLDAPFDDCQFDWMQSSMCWKTPRDLEMLPDLLNSFRPDVIVFAGWTIPQYRKIARSWKAKALRIMTMDNPWRGNAKQLLGVIISQIYLKPLADFVWLPGERQACFARKLGFSQRQILRGLYCCEPRLFAEAANRVHNRDASFIFVGRLVHDKGTDTLAQAYQAYRTRSENPWNLHVYGVGPLRFTLEDIPGVVLHDFVQPQDLPDVMAHSTCFILPSRIENWGVAVHEAAAAGLILLASEAVGSVPHLVQPHVNGYVLPVNDADSLCSHMLKIERMKPEQSLEMSLASYGLAQQFSPRHWADILLDTAAFV